MTKINPLLFPSSSYPIESCSNSPLRIAAFADSLQIAAPLTVCQTIRYFLRMISNWFRGLFSKVLPIQPRAPISLNALDYFRLESFNFDDIVKYVVRVDGVKTKNQIKFKKEGTDLQLLEFTFPDVGMKEHIGMILDHILETEKAVSFSTSKFDRAKILWDCGFSTSDSISFCLNGTDLTDHAISKLIEKAKENRNGLNTECLESLKRIEKEMVPEKSLLGSFIDLGSSFLGEAPNFKRVKLPLVDLLQLMEIFQQEKFKDLSFCNNKNGGLVEFQKG